MVFKLFYLPYSSPLISLAYLSRSSFVFKGEDYPLAYGYANSSNIPYKFALDFWYFTKEENCTGNATISVFVGICKYFLMISSTHTSLDIDKCPNTTSYSILQQGSYESDQFAQEMYIDSLDIRMIIPSKKEKNTY